MYEDPFIKKLLQLLFCSNGSLKMRRSNATRTAKIPVAQTEVVLLWIFYPGENKEWKKQRFVQQKAYALSSADVHFVSGTLNIHR